MFFFDSSAFHTNHPSEEGLSTVMHEHIFKTAEILLTAVADVVAEAHIIPKVAKPSRQIMFLGVQRLTAVTQTEWLSVDAPAAFASLGVHSNRSIARLFAEHEMPAAQSRTERARDA